MKHFNLHAILNSVLLIGVITAGIIHLSSKKQSMAYVDNIQLFNDFHMTKDIKTIEEQKIKEKGKQLDGIYKQLQSEKNQKSNLAKQYIKQLNDGSAELDAMKENYQNNLSQNVWNRLNDYIEEYSKKEQINIVLGVSGNGNVMYAEDTINITNELLEYSNSKYEGQ